MKQKSVMIVFLVALLAIGLTPLAFAGPWGTWYSAGTLINIRQMHAAAYNTTDSVLYVMAGNSDDPQPEDFVGQYNDVVGSQYYKMNTAGAYPVVDTANSGWGPPMMQFNIECWDNVALTTVTACVSAYNADGAFIIGRKLYFTPCNTNASIPWGINDILMTDISTTGGLLGTWSIAGHPATSGAGRVVFDAGWAVHLPSNRLYRVAGREADEGCAGTGVGYLTTAHSGQIQGDGTITNWRSENAIPATANYGMLEIVNNLAIWIGGAYYSAVYVSQIGADGVLGPWTASANPFPSNVGFCSGCSDGDYVYVLTGRVSSSVSLTTCYRAKVNLAGTDLDPWEEVAVYPYSARYAAAAGGAGKFFSTGGRNYTDPSHAQTNDIFTIGYTSAVGDWSMY
jgi:hypothetical protein